MNSINITKKQDEKYIYFLKDNSHSPIVTISKERKAINWSACGEQSLENTEIFKKALKLAINELKIINFKTI